MALMAATIQDWRKNQLLVPSKEVDPKPTKGEGSNLLARKFMEDAADSGLVYVLIGKECATDSPRSQVQSAEFRVDDKQEQEKESGNEDNIPMQCDSNIIVRASQVNGINLHVDLNPSAVRRNVRSQQLEASLSSEGDEVSNCAVNFEPEEEDDEVDNTDGDMDASKKKKDFSVDDMEKQRIKISEDRAKNNEEEVEEFENNGFNGSHHSGLEKEPAHKKQADSQSPINEECLESANNRSQVQSAEFRVDDKQEQEKESGNEDNIPMQCDSNIIIIIEYEKKNEDVPPPQKYMNVVNRPVKDVDAKLVQA
ncbi:hypothetical protein RHGRI_026710 [Rhododendron griersonianum]|uniref:Bet v I/Major latex protein domain-containing protein n=1 Tax=Rhododendron griersonianum TaxID=479676 RepID=A0AAV6ITU3_9ERIC|nr:hypothetical protein RHGRI_026710 [Rhododendron griersonianum]